MRTMREVDNTYLYLIQIKGKLEKLEGKCSIENTCLNTTLKRCLRALNINEIFFRPFVSAAQFPLWIGVPVVQIRITSRQLK